MKNNVLIAFGFGALCVVCATVLAATNHLVPVELWTLAGVGVGGGAGVALPGIAAGVGAGVASSAQVSAATVAGGVASAPAPAPAPAAATEQTSLNPGNADPRTLP